MPDKLIEVFFSYSHKDKRLRDTLANDLKIFEHLGAISGWHDRKITAGSEWKGQIDEHLNTAHIILLLISSDFMASDYCYDIEVKRAMERHDKGEARVIPIILRPCSWHRMPFGKLQALPTDARAITDWSNRDKAFLDIVEGIKAVLKGMTVSPLNLPPSSGTEATGQQQASTHSRIWNIPHPRNRNFTGRENELAELRESLLAGETAALMAAQAVYGLGGVGKTQLAIEYAYRHRADYNVVWWMRSEDLTTLASDYAGLAVKLNLPEKDATEQRVIVEAVKEWLRLNHGWLLIFDNAEEVQPVRGYIPQASAGHIIVTSRNPNWKSVATPLAVEPLPMNKAIEFLRKRAGQQDNTTATRLAEALGCLPLALEQAGAYIEASGCKMPHYLELFEQHQDEMMQRGELSTEYPDTVATTWSISFQKVESKNPAAAELLRLCAFFAPDDIPIKILVAGAEEMPESLSAIATDAVGLDEAVMALRKYSLIERDNETLTIHRLVQAVIRHAMEGEAFKRWTGVAVHIVNTAFPEDSHDVRMWPICSPLLPHASAALSYAEAIRFASNETARLLNEIGVYLYARAEYAQAKRMLERALAIDEAALGPDHPDVAIRLNDLGNVLREQGDLAGAKAHLERALAISEAALGPNHPTVAIRLISLGTVLREQGDLAGAKVHLECALAIDEAVYGSDHPDVAIDLNNLGLVLESQGDLAGAKVLFERALAISETVLGPNHPTVAIRLNNLGNVLREQGDLAGAKALYERALAIDEAALGPNHPKVAIRLNNLGLVLESQSDLAGAKALFERALRIFREYLGDEHPSTKRVQENLLLLEAQLNVEP